MKDTIYIIQVGKRKRLYFPMPNCLKNRETILIECRQTFKNTNEDGVDRELNFKWCFWKHLLSKRVDKVIKVIRNDIYDRYKPFYLFHLYAPIYLLGLNDSLLYAFLIITHQEFIDFTFWCRRFDQKICHQIMSHGKND